ncbi:MAG: RHS repeat-associated core domain-containing protein [Vicinamibacterales bacterium]
MRFVRAAQDANPGAGVADRTPNAWEEVRAACPAGPNVTPGATSQTPPAPPPPQGNADSAVAQGAPAPTVPPLLMSTLPPLIPELIPSLSEEPRRPPPAQVDPAQVRETPQSPKLVSDPVDIFSGAYFASEMDLEVPNTLLPLAFVRSYRSGVAVFGPLGWNWDHNFNLYVRELATGDVALWRSLHEDVFVWDGAMYQPPRGVFELLERTAGRADGWALRGVRGTLMRFGRPPGWIDGERIPLVAIEDAHGNALRLSYGAEDRLVEVRDDHDRFLRLDYDDCGVLDAVSDHAGRRYVYGHNEETLQLESVTTPPTTDHPAGIIRRYHYADPALPPQLRHNIVRVEDADGRVFLENTYDEDPASLGFARVTEQLFGANRYQYCFTPLQWVPAESAWVNVAAVQVEVMNPDFGVETYTFNFRGDLLDERFRLVKDRSYRVIAIGYSYDEQGNVTAITSPGGGQQLDSYDTLHPDPRMRGLLRQRELTAATGFPAPSRIVWRGRYDPDYGLLTEEISERGAVTRYVYDFDLTPGAPDNSGKLKRIDYPLTTLPDGTTQKGQTIYEHAANGRVTAIEHPDGTRTELEYAPAGPDGGRLRRRTTDANGLALVESYEYDAFGYQAVTRDARGAGTVRTLNALGQVERITFPAVDGEIAEQRIRYDSDRRVAAFERPRGEYDDPVLNGQPIVDRFSRDVLGNPVEYVLAANTATPRRVRSKFDHRGFPVRTFTPDGTRTDRVYDERGKLIEETALGADGTRRTNRDAYDADGQITRVTGASGAATRYEHDGFGRLSRVFAPSGTRYDLAWDAGDVLESVRVTGVDQAGAMRLLGETRYRYDERGRRTHEIARAFDRDPAAAINVVSTFFHDEADRLSRTVDHRGAQTTYAFDGGGRLDSVIDPVGNEEQREYDANGNLTLIRRRDREPDGTISVRVVRQEWDERNRLSATIQPDGARSTVIYDARDLPVEETDARGLVIAIAHDAFGVRVRETVDPGGLGLVHAWQHDALGRQIAYVDPSGATTSFDWDGLGRLRGTTYPGGISSQREWDSAGNLLSETLGSGVRFEFSHDGADRLQRIRNTAAPPGVRPLPDQLFARDGLDRVTSARLGTDEVSRRFDSFGRLRSERTRGAELRCDYDDTTGTMIKIWPDGRTEEVGTNLSGTPVSWRRTAAGALGGPVTTIATQAASGPDLLGAATLAGAVELTATYDDRKRLSSLVATSTAGLAETIALRYDTTDRRRVEVVEGSVPALSYAEYDEPGRVTRVARGAALALPNATTQADNDAAIVVAAAATAMASQTTWAYDDADARQVARETGQPDRLYVNDASHRPRTAGVEIFGHSADGVRLSDGRFTYEADALGRIVAIKTAAGTVCELRYDALGRPSTIAEAARPVRSLHWFADHVEQESEGAIVTRQITRHPGTGSEIARHVAGATRFPLWDARGNLTALVNSAGALLESYRYGAFGEPTIFDAAGAPVVASAYGVDPIFGGQRYLSDTGLYLSTRRLMDPRHGVFLSLDPLGYTRSPSLYAYAAQDPLNLIDPDGEFPFLALFIVMGIGALVSGALNATRQGIQMAENPARRREGFSWGELGMSMGIGAVAAPVLVVAPELAIPLAALGVYNGVGEFKKGNNLTGAFDIVTSIVPFMSTSARGAALGRGSYIGQWRGLGPSVPMSMRLDRFSAIEKNLLATLRPLPFGGRRVGIGIARNNPNQSGHAGVFVDDAQGNPTLFHKNGREVDGVSVADWQVESPLPGKYPIFNPRKMKWESRDWKYVEWRAPRQVAEAMAAYAEARTNPLLPPEPFVLGKQSCGNFTSDVFAAGGVRVAGNFARGVFNNTVAFIDASEAASMAYAAGFWTGPLASNVNRKCSPGR